MDNETKATLEILIREIQDILDEPHLRASQIESELTILLQSWIEGNNLHPEQVAICPIVTSSNAWNESKENQHFFRLSLGKNKVECIG